MTHDSTSRRRRRHGPARRDRRRRRPGPTASPRCRARSPSPRDLSADGCAVGRDAALAAPVRPDRVDRPVARRWRSPASRRSSPPTTCPGQLTYGLITPGPAGVRLRRRALRRRAGGRRRRRPPRDVPAGARRDRRRVRGARAAARPRGGDRRQPPADPPRRQRASATSGSCAATPTPPATSSSRAPTRSACRTRRSSGSRRRWPSPTAAAAASSCTSPPSGCTRTASRSPPASASPDDRCGSCSAASAARSAPARTSACRCTPACSRCAPAGRCGSHYSREESFLGHVHRHPATIWMRHHATADGEIVKIEARFVFDGGAYASTSSAVLINAHHPHPGPVPVRRTPSSTAGPCAPTTCRAARCAGSAWCRRASPTRRQMDKLAAACGLDPVEIRLRNAMQTGDALITGQVVESVAPVDAVHPRDRRAAAARPSRSAAPTATRCACPAAPGAPPTPATCAAASAAGVAIKNLMYSEGFDDYSTARCRLADGVATLKFATAEVGQGFVTHRRADRPHRSSASTRSCSTRSTPQVGSAGSTSASRQTWMSGGAVDAACRAVRERLFEHVGAAHGIDAAAPGDRRHRRGRPIGSAADAGRRGHRPASRSTRPSSTTTAPTEDLDEDGQGNCHTAFAFVAHRAVVDVDPELGLVQGGAGRHRPGRRPGAQPAVGASARSRAASPRASGWR